VRIDPHCDAVDPHGVLVCASAARFAASDG
jgi:hypothetical protein